MTTHTPGATRLAELIIREGIDRNGRPSRIWTAYGFVSRSDLAEMIDNESGVKDLLASCREMTLCFGRGNESTEWWEHENDRRGPAGDGLSSDAIREQVVETARAAIAKATGDSANVPT